MAVSTVAQQPSARSSVPAAAPEAPRATQAKAPDAPSQPEDTVSRSPGEPEEDAHHEHLAALLENWGEAAGRDGELDPGDFHDYSEEDSSLGEAARFWLEDPGGAEGQPFEWSRFRHLLDNLEVDSLSREQVEELMQGDPTSLQLLSDQWLDVEWQDGQAFWRGTSDPLSPDEQAAIQQAPEGIYQEAFEQAQPGAPGIELDGHDALDAAGLIPGLGEAADLVNAGWYALEGDWANAGISLAGLIPFVGQAATGTRLAGNVVEGVARTADDVTPPPRPLQEAAQEAVERAYTIDPNKYRYFFGELERPPDSLLQTDPARYRQLMHNYDRSQQNARDLAVAGINNDAAGRAQLEELFQQGLDAPQVSARTTEYGTSITRSVEVNGVRLDIVYHYDGSSELPGVVSIIPRVLR